MKNCCDQLVVNLITAFIMQNQINITSEIIQFRNKDYASHKKRFNLGLLRPVLVIGLHDHFLPLPILIVFDLRSSFWVFEQRKILGRRKSLKGCIHFFFIDVIVQLGKKCSKVWRVLRRRGFCSVFVKVIFSKKIVFEKKDIVDLIR